MLRRTEGTKTSSGRDSKERAPAHVTNRHGAFPLTWLTARSLKAVAQGSQSLLFAAAASNTCSLAPPPPQHHLCILSQEPRGGFLIILDGRYLLIIYDYTSPCIHKPIEDNHRQNPSPNHALHSCLISVLFFIISAMHLSSFSIGYHCHCVLVYALLIYVLCCCHTLAPNKFLFYNPEDLLLNCVYLPLW